MRLIKVSRSSTSATKLKFVFCLILVEGALCVQTQVNGSEKNTTEKNGPDSSGSATNNEPIKPEIKNGAERKDSYSRSPAPVQESTESEEHKEYLFENDSVHETISPVHEVDQHPTTVSNQEIHVPESSRESVGFQPSMHLGQIGEINFTGTIMNPFNKVHHVGFENVVSPEANIGTIGTHPLSVREKTVKFYDTDNGYKPEAVKLQPIQPIQLSEYLHNLQNQQHVQSQYDQNHYAESDYAHRTPTPDMKIIQGVLSMRPVTFDGGNHYVGTPERPYHYANIEKPYPVIIEKPYHVENIERPYHVVNVGKPYSHANFQKPYSFVNTETPHHFVFEKPVKVQSEEKFVQPLYAQGHEHIKPFRFEHVKKPEFEFEHFQKPELHFEHFKKPEFELEHFKKPEVHLEHFKKPEYNLEYFKKPEYNLEYYKKPDTSVDYLHPGLHDSTENFGTFGKPQSVVYITTHEATVTRTKKYPHHLHSPLLATELPMLHENHSDEHDSHEKRLLLLSR